MTAMFRPKTEGNFRYFELNNGMIVRMEETDYKSRMEESNACYAIVQLHKEAETDGFGFADGNTFIILKINRDGGFDKGGSFGTEYDIKREIIYGDTGTTFAVTPSQSRSGSIL